MFGTTCLYFAINRVLTTVCDLEVNPNDVRTKKPQIDRVRLILWAEV